MCQGWEVQAVSSIHPDMLFWVYAITMSSLQSDFKMERSKLWSGRGEEEVCAVRWITSMRMAGRDSSYNFHEVINVFK